MTPLGMLPSNLVLSGYLLVHQIHHKNLTSIPLPNLRLIRGQRLYHHNPTPDNKNSGHNYSMVLFGGCTYCTSLGLNNLVGASTQYSSISTADRMDRNQEVSYFPITGPSQIWTNIYLTNYIMRIYLFSILLYCRGISRRHLGRFFQR